MADTAGTPPSLDKWTRDAPNAIQAMVESIRGTSQLSTAPPSPSKRPWNDCVIRLPWWDFAEED
ncbi:hypothetical protein [Streptomyces sp. NPDC003006]